MYSLIVPFLNREKYLPRMLDSLNRCHKKPAMTIFVNNGSTDTSEEIIRAFFFSHPGLPYTIINEKKPGASAARNAGLQCVKTEWVYFFDSDDELSPDYFTDITETIKQYPEVDLIASPTTIIFANGKEKRRAVSFTDRLTDHIIVQSLCTQSMFFRTSFLRSIGGWNERAIIWNDWELGIRVLRRGARVRWMKRPYHYINRHTESITGTGFSQRVEHILQTLSLVSNELRDNPGALKALQGRVVIVAGTLRREGDKNGAAHLLDFAQNLTTPPLSPALNMIYRLTAAGIPGMWRAVRALNRI